MTQIDWSKAPEGATHFLPEQVARGWVACWYKNVGGIWFARNKNDLDWYPDNDYQEVFIPLLIERQPEWTGEGLPPIGTVCECRVTANAEWVRCEIVAHKDHYAIAYVDENTVMLSQGIRFRHIRTQEQIKAEEIEIILNWMVNRDSERGLRGLRGIAEDLHADGYRKQVMADAEEVKS